MNATLTALVCRVFGHVPGRWRVEHLPPPPAESNGTARIARYCSRCDCFLDARPYERRHHW